MSIIRILLLFHCFLIAKLCAAQTTESFSNHIGYRAGIGFITNHSPSMLYYTNQHIAHHEITFEESNFLDSDWGSEYPNSNYGFGLSIYDFNTNVIGQGVSFYPYLNFRLLNKEKLQFIFRTAIGLGYIEKPYDEINNYKNSAIGTRLNLYFNFLGELRWQFHQQFALSIASDFGHFSNTSFQKPNLGINIPSLNAGLYYSFGEKRQKTKPVEPEFSPKSFITEASAALGFNEVYPANGDKYLAKFLALHRVKKLNPKSSIYYGMEFFQNPAVSEVLKRDSIKTGKDWEASQIGIAIGHYLHLGKFALGNTLGYYLKNENPYYTKMYFGVSGNYSFTKRSTAFINLKTHKAEAEYLLIGIRFKLHE